MFLSWDFAFTFELNAYPLARLYTIIPLIFIYIMSVKWMYLNNIVENVSFLCHLFELFERLLWDDKR